MFIPIGGKSALDHFNMTLGHVPTKSIKLHKVCARACVWRMNEKKKREREISSNKEKKKKTD